MVFASYVARSTARTTAATAVTVALVALLAACGLGGTLGAEELAKPTTVPDAEAYLLAIVPDLQATLGRAEQIGSLFTPAPVPAGTYSAAMGGAFGDPGFANLAKGPLMVAVGPGVPTPSIALLLPATDLQKAIDLAAQKGFLMGKAVGAWAVVAQTPDGQALGERIAAAYPAMPAVPAGTDLRLLTAPSRLVKAYGAFITGLVQMGTMNIPHQPGQPPVAKIAMLEFAGLIEVLGGIDSSQVDITLANRTVAINQLIAAVADSALAKALVAPAPGPNRAAQRFSAAPGAELAAFSGRINVPAMVDYITSLATVLIARPEAKDLLPADFKATDVIAQVKDLAAVWTGETAMRMHGGGPLPLQWEAVAGISDAAKATHLYELFFDLYTGDGALAKFNQGLGITMLVNKAERTSGGLPVWQQTWKFDEAKQAAGNPNANNVAKLFMRPNELVIGPDFTVNALDPQQLDALVVGKGTGLRTRAEAAFGAGRQLYSDLDLPGLMRALLQAAPAAPGQVTAPAPGAPAPGAPAPSDPLLAALTTGDGRQRVELRIPLAPFVGLGAIVQALQPPRPGRGPRPPAAQPPPTGGNTF